ncbi:MAG TPA: ABC transporter substrate-binding protein, partial [Longimicrobium sp.]|nr:ABC transporter substrate-binding protein [Longimicrobium sp.]
AAALAAAAACSGDRPERRQPPGAAGEPGTPERGGTAVVVELGDMDQPLPLLAQGGFDADLVDVMFMGLTRSAWRDGRVVYLTSNDSPMALAYHWEYVGADSAALRYRMRHGLRWSDGAPITAHDVAWTYRMLADSQVASPRQEDVAQIDSVVADDDSTVTFHFRRRYPEMLFASGVAIAPKHVYEQGGPGAIRTHPSLTDPVRGLVVSGPFKVGAWQRGTSITLVPNPEFTVKPYLDRVVIRIIPEATTRLVELRNGTADFVRAISFDQVPQVRAARGQWRIERERGRFWEYLAYRPDAHPAFADPQVRRALGMALDVPSIIRGLQMEDFTVPAAGPYSPIFRDLYDPQRMHPLAYDTAGARRLLDERGWTDQDGDGVREKNGKPLRFTLLTNAGNARRNDVTQIVQQQWKRVGVDARLRQMETPTFLRSVYEKKFEAALGSWGVALSPDITQSFRTGGPFNVVSYASPEVDRMMDQALAQPTAEKADPLWRAAAERIVQDQPYTWLYFYDPLTAVSGRLRGVRVDSYGAYQNLWEWWIPRQMRGGEGQPAANDTGKGKR